MSTQSTIKKVIAYVTNKDELMVFTHTDFPEAGVQVPAGTIEENEQASEAVLREIYEESGVKGVRIIELLGIYQYNMAPYRDEIQERYVYHQKVQKSATRKRGLSPSIQDKFKSLLTNMSQVDTI
ncbi:MAG: NUDIX domain-containing protein [Desmonostoc geniculatum HA4340-LM1]|jgi:ADP-ribose pyrophosphatase YjhB (NUDIX family)|nr:NUDIX domain-containing protein [Desmonostoc geniculatum HA4340-LM1]